MRSLLLLSAACVLLRGSLSVPVPDTEAPGNALDLRADGSDPGEDCGGGRSYPLPPEQLKSLRNVALLTFARR